MALAIISDAIVAEVSAGRAAFSSFLWTIGLIWLFWFELKRGPRCATRFDNAFFHYAALTLIGLGIIVNLTLTVLFTSAAFTV